MSKGISKAVVVVGVLLMVHAGYSTTKYKELLAVAEDPEAPRLPFDVLVEVCVACALTLLGTILVQGKMEAIHVAEEKERSLDVLNSRPDFALYNHRGHAFAELRKRFGAEGAGATR